MNISDSSIELEIGRLEAAIKTWAKREDMWFDCGFTTWLERHNDEPSNNTPVLVMWADGPLCQMWNFYGYDEQYDQFQKLLDEFGYEYENHDGVSIGLYAKNDAFQGAFNAYVRWKWICKLVMPDFSDVCEDIYNHFGSRPDDLYKLPPRQFEVLLSRVFQAQGFIAELGPGSGDGGVDVRLWHRDPLGDILTLVQAKRYKPTLSIDLGAVAALSGVVEDERANRGLFVTTSRFLPSAKSFAARQKGRIVLADSSDVAKWCNDAAGKVILDKSTLISDDYVQRLLGELQQRADFRLVHATYGCNMILNRFAVVLKETKHAALLMKLPSQAVSGDGQQGCEIPCLDNTVATKNTDTVFRVSRRVDTGGRVTYWGGGNLYSVWNGNPQFFTMMD
jgi:hypothetical protein